MKLDSSLRISHGRKIALVVNTSHGHDHNVAANTRRIKSNSKPRIRFILIILIPC